MALFAKGKTQDDPLALLQAGEFKKAVRLLEAKLKRNPNDPSLRWRLAEAYEGAGRADDAAAIYREEAEGALASGDRSKAVALLRKAAKLAPSDEDLAKRIAGLEDASPQSGVFSFDLSEHEPSREDVIAGEPPAAPLEEITAAAKPRETGGQTAASAAGPLPTEMIEPPLAEGGLLSALAPEGPREVGSDDAALLIEAFPGLDPNEVMDLMDAFSRKELEAGEVLLREGEPGEAVYLVTRGRLAAKAVISGEVVELAVLERGDVLGEVAFLNQVPRTATVEAVEPSTVLEMPGAAARKRLDSLPQVKERLERLIEERVERTIALVKTRLKPFSR